MFNIKTNNMPQAIIDFTQTEFKVPKTKIRSGSRSKSKSKSRQKLLNSPKNLTVPQMDH